MTYGGGLERIDAQGNVVGQYYQPQRPEEAEGGRGWNLYQQTSEGGPTPVEYPVDKGGVFGLGPGWGSLVGAALAIGGGIGLGYAMPVVGTAIGGVPAAGVGALEAGAVAGAAAGTDAALWGGTGLGVGAAGDVGLTTGLEAVPGVLGGAAAGGGSVAGIPISTLA